MDQTIQLKIHNDVGKNIPASDTEDMKQIDNSFGR